MAVPMVATPQLIASSAGANVAPLAPRPLGGLLDRTSLYVQALGLDAVAVALVWQEAFGQLARRSPLPAARIGLAVVVAFVYILDRQLDAARSRGDAEMSARHRLHTQSPFRFRVLLASLVVAGLLAVPFVRHETVVACGWLGVIVAAYLAGVQLLPASFRSGVKELSVGFIFATGCAAHTLPRLPEMSPDLLPALLLTGLLFALNCISISTREAALDRGQGMPGLAMTRRWFGLAAALLMLAAAVTNSPVAPAVMISAALLLSLQFTRRPAAWHRLAADAALLSPLPIWVLEWLAGWVRS